MDDRGTLALFNGQQALGCVVHQPCPRHWLALVPPQDQEDGRVAALLCDSLETQAYALSAEEVEDLFVFMGSSHLSAGETQLTLQQQEEQAAGWCAYRLTR